MRIIYIDTEFMCHVSNNEDNSLIAIETDYFDGKCDKFIEGYRFIPSGETWVRHDGIVFYGEMIAPWMSYQELDKLQKEYEEQLLMDFDSAMAEIETALESSYIS